MWNSVATQVLLPDGLAIHIGLKHNSTEFGDEYLEGALIGRLAREAEQVTPGPHAWDGRYTDLRIAWKGHSWRIQSAARRKRRRFVDNAALVDTCFCTAANHRVFRSTFCGTGRARHGGTRISSRLMAHRE